MAEKQPAHVVQALNELANTDNEDQVRAARKRLAAAGYEHAAQSRAQAADDDDGDGGGEDRKTAPKGRATRQDAKGATT